MKTAHVRAVKKATVSIPGDINVRPRARSGNYADEQYRKEALRTLAKFRGAKPDEGKKWIRARRSRSRALRRDAGVTFVDTGAQLPC